MGIKFKISIVVLMALVLVFFALGCGNSESGAVSEGSAAPSEQESSEEEVNLTMIMKIDNKEVPVIWEDNESVKELSDLARDGLEISMSMYGGFEQVGPIGKSIAKNDRHTTTSSGDIVLYSGNQMVVFYGSNSWAYTRLGKIDLSGEELKELLGNKDVTITLSVD